MTAASVEAARAEVVPSRAQTLYESRMPLGIRIKVFFAAVPCVLLAVLGAHAILTRPLAGKLTASDNDALHAPAPIVAAGMAIVVAAVLALLAGSWVRKLGRPLADATKRLREGDLSARVTGQAPDLDDVAIELDRLSWSLQKTMADLRAERDRVTSILDGMQEGVLLLDREGHIRRMNTALREMVLLRGDVVGEPLLEVVRHAELKELLDRAARVGSASGEIDVGGLKPRRLLVRATAKSGEVVAVFVDVTEIRRLESLRKDFVANVSHELRTPVTSVLSAAETLRGAAVKDPAAAARFLDIIERNAGRLQRLIEDLLDLSRIESREFKLKPERVPLDTFFQHVVTMFRERAEKKKIKLTGDAESSALAWADRRALEQVVTNLVDNAVKYCPEGAEVRVRAETRGSSVDIAVEDTGAGIEASHLPRLFERFYRVDTGRSRELGGTGLGLSIVRHLVEAMGGSVGVDSVVGKGTVFRTTLPAQAPSISPDPPPASVG